MKQIRLTDETVKFFWSRVSKVSDGCWLWTGMRTALGYGVLSKGRLYAHRVSYQMHFGTPKHEVCHRCDNPRCVRPGHLFDAPHRDNMRDSVRKGRFGLMLYPERRARGMRHPLTTLTDDEVMAIRHRYSSESITQRQLALEYGVCQATIRCIVKRIYWQHV